MDASTSRNGLNDSDIADDLDIRAEIVPFRATSV